MPGAPLSFAMNVYPVIKLTVHESVEVALQKAFPSLLPLPSALAKYISVVESMLFDALQRGQTGIPPNQSTHFSVGCMVYFL
jgi:hypothetical protein